MKKILLTLLLLAAAFINHAQKIDSSNILTNDPVVAMNNSRIYYGFTIKLISKNITSYSFDILADKNLAHHFQNPLPFARKGIQKKEDAYKVAQWIISEYKKTGHWENMMPPHIARQLQIDWN
jgi:hypothetical protein